MSEMLRVYPAYVKGEPQEVLAKDKTFLQIWAALGCSRTEAINRIFEEGLDSLAKSEELEGKIDQKSLAIFKEYQKVQTELSERSMLESIYEHKNLDEFRKFCDEHGIDHEAFLKGYQFSPSSGRAKSKVMDGWIRYLLSDGGKHSVHEIRNAAELEGIVLGEDDWNLMKSVASQKGYSGNAERGYWSLVKS